MENNWEPRVGQKVVALRDGRTSGVIIKGTTYTANDVFTCPSCGRHHVTLEEIKRDSTYKECYTCNCGKVLKSIVHYIGGFAGMFAPLPEQYADMTSEIAKSFVEHPDKADQPVKVLETVN